MMLHEPTPDIYRIAGHAKQCLPLLREHQKRDELLDLSLDAGDSARARGAHEVGTFIVLLYIMLTRNSWPSKRI